MSCAIIGCLNRKSKVPGITFHTLPKDETSRAAWVDAVKGKSRKESLSKYTLLCSKHFKDSDFDRASTMKVSLHKGVVPSIFNDIPKPKITKKHSKDLYSLTSQASKDSGLEEALIVEADGSITRIRPKRNRGSQHPKRKKSATPVSVKKVTKPKPSSAGRAAEVIADSKNQPKDCLPSVEGEEPTISSKTVSAEETPATQKPKQCAPDLVRNARAEASSNQVTQKSSEHPSDIVQIAFQNALADTSFNEPKRAPWKRQIRAADRFTNIPMKVYLICPKCQKPCKACLQTKAQLNQANAQVQNLKKEKQLMLKEKRSMQKEMKALHQKVRRLEARNELLQKAVQSSAQDELVVIGSINGVLN